MKKITILITVLITVFVTTAAFQIKDTMQAKNQLKMYDEGRISSIEVNDQTVIITLRNQTTNVDDLSVTIKTTNPMLLGLLQKYSTTVGNISNNVRFSKADINTITNLIERALPNTKAEAIRLLQTYN
jgi:hypothetical protein